MGIVGGGNHVVETAIRQKLKNLTGELTDTGHMGRLSIFDFLLPSLPES